MDIEWTLNLAERLSESFNGSSKANSACVFLAPAMAFARESSVMLSRQLALHHLTSAVRALASFSSEVIPGSALMQKV